jgi:carbon-monoxide dehydrogenase medium subunit
MKWPAFAYARATTLDDLWRLRAEAGPDARIVAGGQTLLASLAFRLSAPSVLIDISRIAALKGISRTAERLRIGALATHAEIGASPEVAAEAPLIAAAIPLIAHAAIRNRGTIGGNIAYADPASELPACLVALDATVVVLGPGGERRIPAGQFFTGLFETALAEDEIVTAVEIRRPAAGEASGIDEVARRSGDYAMAGLCIRLTHEAGALRAARIVGFGVGETPVLCAAASQALVTGGVEAAVAALDQDLDPAGDLQASPAMKRHLAKVLLRRIVGRLTAPEAMAA